MPTPTDLSAVIRLEHDALAAETRIAQCPPFVAVNDLSDVTRVPSALRFTHKATVSPLTNAKGGAFIVACPSLNSAVLWVDVDNDRYRDDYLTFLNAEYQLGLESIPKPFDVDHLYNRARARAYGLRFIRTALVGSAPNRSHGAGPEKDVTKRFESGAITS